MSVCAVVSTNRDDGAHCGAGPPCTFRYARTSRFMCCLKVKHPLGLRDVRRLLALLGVRTTLCEIAVSCEGATGLAPVVAMHHPDSALIQPPPTRLVTWVWPM